MRSRSILLPILGGLIGIAGGGFGIFYVIGLPFETDSIIRPWLLALHLAGSLVVSVACVALAGDSIGRREWAVEGWVAFGAWSIVTVVASFASASLAFSFDYYLPLWNLIAYGLLWLVLAGKLLNIVFPLIRVEGLEHTWEDEEPNPGVGRRVWIGLASFGVAMLSFLLLSLTWIEPGHVYVEGSASFTADVDSVFFLTVPLLTVGGLWAFQVLPFPRRARKILLWTKMVLATCFGALAITAFIAYAHPAFGVLAIVFLVQLVAALYIAGPVLGWSVKILPGQSEFTR